MEQVHSLINRLTRQVNANVHSAELLSTIEMLRQEIAKANAGPSVKQGQAVYVWMPTGFGQPKTNGHHTNGASHVNGHHQNGTAVLEAPVIEKAPQVIQAAPVQEPIAMPAVPRQVYTAPTPPPVPVIAVQKPKEDEEEFHLDVEPTEEELAIIDKKVSDEKKTAEEAQAFAPASSFPAPEINYAYIKVQELAAAAHAKHAAPVAVAEAKPFPKYSGMDTTVRSSFPAAPAPVVKKEINELVLDPAIPLNQKLKTNNTELAEVLASGPKIADLRKAFGINERYQVINGLFRGDQDMFDRSVRTLNNFGNYQEASFWMQRELVIKLGWNEEDELVQNFYKLLSRRF